MHLAPSHQIVKMIDPYLSKYKLLEMYYGMALDLSKGSCIVSPTTSSTLVIKECCTYPVKFSNPIKAKHITVTNVSGVCHYTVRKRLSGRSLLQWPCAGPLWPMAFAYWVGVGTARDTQAINKCLDQSLHQKGGCQASKMHKKIQTKKGQFTSY